MGEHISKCTFLIDKCYNTDCPECMRIFPVNLTTTKENINKAFDESERNEKNWK